MSYVNITVIIILFLIIIIIVTIHMYMCLFILLLLLMFFLLLLSTCMPIMIRKNGILILIWILSMIYIYIHIIDPIHIPFFLQENHLHIANWSLQGWWSSSHVRHWRCWELIGGRIPLMWAIFYREHMGKSWAYCHKPRNLGSKWWGTWWLTFPSSHESG